MSDKLQFILLIIFSTLLAHFEKNIGILMENKFTKIGAIHNSFSQIEPPFVNKTAMTF